MAEQNPQNPQKGHHPAQEREQTLGITVKKSEDFVEWYNQVVLKAALADYAPIKGFMIIRPNGYAIWEAIQSNFDAAIFFLFNGCRIATQFFFKFFFLSR